MHFVLTPHRPAADADISADFGGTLMYIPLVGIGLAVWGLIVGDWFKISVGALLFFGAFAMDVFRKRAVMKDDQLFAVYRPLTDLIRIVHKSIEAAAFDAESPKGKLAQGLFFMGMVDAASQAAKLSDRQFLELFTAVFHDLDLGDTIKSRVLLFHQSLKTTHPAYAAIMKGGEVYTKFVNGNSGIPLVVGSVLEEIVNKPDFPASADRCEVG